MKEATKLLIENGIIPESVVKLCQIWGGEEVSIGNKDATQKELLSVVKKVAELLESDDVLPEIKETDLELDNIAKKARTMAILAGTTNSGVEMEMKAIVGFTPAGKMVVKVVGRTEGRYAEKFAQKGNRLSLSDGREVVISHVEPRYVGEKLGFYVCDLVAADA